MWSIFIISLAVALCISAMCSLCEAALLSLTPGELEDFAEDYPKKARVWKNFKENIEEPIAVILILNTAAHTIGATVAGAQFSDLGYGKYLTFFSIIFTFLMLQYTEILPKTLGVAYNTKVAYIMTRPMQFLVWFLKPVVKFLHIMNRPFEAKNSDDNPDTLDEITALVRLASFSKLIDKNQERIFQETTRLQERSAKEVMIPVEQITFLSTQETIGQAIIAAHLDPHTRFPLIEGKDTDNIVGYINFKELVVSASINKNVKEIRDIARTVHFVNESEPVLHVLRLFVNHHAHIAIVRNKAGKTLGMITMEDIVEELVGELEDEFDLLPQSFHLLTGGALVLGGGVPTKKVFETIKADWEVEADVPTISAWMLKRFGKLPNPGENFHYEGWNFIARRIRRGQIFEVTVLPSGDDIPL
ncbi:MAG: hemolysin family protein [Planctomycetia bacterium]|nr:hemolysin family protein [Planctomycetia bacterium]